MVSSHPHHGPQSLSGQAWSYSPTLSANRASVCGGSGLLIPVRSMRPWDPFPKGVLHGSRKQSPLSPNSSAGLSCHVSLIPPKDTPGSATVLGLRTPEDWNSSKNLRALGRSWLGGSVVRWLGGAVSLGIAGGQCLRLPTAHCMPPTACRPLRAAHQGATRSVPHCWRVVSTVLRDSARASCTASSRP